MENAPGPLPAARARGPRRPRPRPRAARAHGAARAAPSRLLVQCTDESAVPERARDARIAASALALDKISLIHSATHLKRRTAQPPGQMTPNRSTIFSFQPTVHLAVARLRPERSTKMQTSSLRQRQADCPAHSLLVLRITIEVERHVLPFRHLLNVPVKVGGARLHAWGRQL